MEVMLAALFRSSFSKSPGEEGCYREPSLFLELSLNLSDVTVKALRPPMGREFGDGFQWKVYF